MLQGNIANANITTPDWESLPFMADILTRKPFVYVCISSNTSIATSVHYLGQKADGTVLARAYAMGTVRTLSDKQVEGFMEKIKDLDYSTPGYADKVLAALEENSPTSTEMNLVIQNSEPTLDITRYVDPIVLTKILSLAEKVSIGQDITNDVICSTCSRIVANNGRAIYDFRLWENDFKNILPLLEALEKEFGHPLKAF